MSRGKCRDAGWWSGLTCFITTDLPLQSLDSSGQGLCSAADALGVSHSRAGVGLLDIIRPRVRNQGKLLLNKWLVVAAFWKHGPCKSSIKLSPAQSWSWGCRDSQGERAGALCFVLPLLQGNSRVPGWWKRSVLLGLNDPTWAEGWGGGTGGHGLGTAEPCSSRAAPSSPGQGNCGPGRRSPGGIKAFLKRSQPEKLPKCF